MEEEGEVRYLLGYVLDWTDKAVKVNVTEHEGEGGKVKKSGEVVWLPLSQVKHKDELVHFEDVEFEVPKWIMEDKRLT